MNDSGISQTDFALFEELAKSLSRRKSTIGFAESCTGGLLSATLCKISGVSDVFLGSVVSYANQVKVDLLNVSWNNLNSFGAVSPEVAQEMARGAQKVLKTDWSLAITGIAGPNGGSDEKPVGTVVFGVLGPQVELTEKQIFSGQRTEIQRQAAVYAVKLLLKLLNK